MGFVEWWKRSSAATADHYTLRFDENDLRDLRGGRLNESARAKFETRLQNYQKITGTVLLGCGVPLLIVMVPFLALLGFGIYRVAGALGRSPVAWIWLGFALLVLGGILVEAVYLVVKMFFLKQNIAADLKTARLGIEAGAVDVKVVSSRNGATIEYWMNGVEYPILGDAIGTAIHHFFSGATKKSHCMNDLYRFYFLPKSKILLHYEKI